MVLKEVNYYTIHNDKTQMVLKEVNLQMVLKEGVFLLNSTGFTKICHFYQIHTSFYSPQFLAKSLVFVEIWFLQKSSFYQNLWFSSKSAFLLKSAVFTKIHGFYQNLWLLLKSVVFTEIQSF